MPQISGKLFLYYYEGFNVIFFKTIEDTATPTPGQNANVQMYN